MLSCAREAEAHHSQTGPKVRVAFLITHGLHILSEKMNSTRSSFQLLSLLKVSYNNLRLKQNTCGNAVSDDKRTFSGFKSQCTICFECKCFKATSIWNVPHNNKLINLSFTNKARQYSGLNGNTCISNLFSTNF